MNATAKTNSTVRARALHGRAECRTVQVVSGDSCAALATRCGISGADFTKYNPGSTFCSTLRPGQHVCCSSGDLPDFRPQPNEDGSCYSYQVKANDNCADLAAAYSLTLDDIEEFNKKTWGWGGCKLLYLGTIMCLSKGTPPFPAPIPNAQCGPQKLGSKPPTDGSDISKLNPCPLNACCNIWGQCGITKDFCIDTNTGPPGTAKPGTYGCISNCGLDIVIGTGKGTTKIGYFEGYGLNRDCLFQDASQIDTSQYTHIHFGFGTLTSSYEVEVGDVLSTYQFGEFKRIKGAKRILSFGGWDFSTSQATYHIFREGVTAANRLKLATNIANFVKKHDLDGVDIDWEYPGAPDIPNIPKGSESDGPNYLAFLVILKNLLPGKSVSIAAPASYWYLKQFPIKEIARVVDYIVYMTYDLHGQWDATGNEHSQEGCAAGNCLRSQVNLTETTQALAMITKAGVPGHKIMVGVTSYGRSFKMAQAGCWGPDCLFTGDRFNSNAKPGRCTGTAGYLADAEIAEILNDQKRSGRVVRSFIDASSNSDILVYDDTEWVSYMSSSTKKLRATLYAIWGMGGTTDWAVDLQTFHDPPVPAKDWNTFKHVIRAGGDPKTDDSRNGNWTDLDCQADAIVHKFDYTPSERWRALNADAAWNDVVRIWKNTDRPRNLHFMESVSQTLRMGAEANCGTFVREDDNCDQPLECPAGANAVESGRKPSGPAAQLIWNSLITIHQMHHDYYDRLFQVASVIGTALDDMENTFAPVLEPDDNTWEKILIDLITAGVLMGAGMFFNRVLGSMSHFVGKPGKLSDLKDATLVMVATSASITKELLPSKQGPWKPEDQDVFSHYIGQVIDGWANITSLAVGRLFNATDESLDILYNAMSDGKLTEGKREGPLPDQSNEDNVIRTNLQRTIFGYTIPQAWRVSNHYAFVLDSGFGCVGGEPPEDKPLDDYLWDDTMDATWGCVDDKLYYLVQPEGDSRRCVCQEYNSDGSCERLNCNKENKFSTPRGIDRLENFGGLTRDELIKGSVRTWIANGKTNGGGFPDTSDRGVAEALLSVDISTPGFVRLPVCSPERAFQSWDTSAKGSSPNYPCDIPPGRDNCGASTFENRGSEASPTVADCLQIIKNIEGDGGTQWTIASGAEHREIAKAGECSFGVKPIGDKLSGNVEFYVGGQDVIDIINEAVKQFGGGGKVGARGYMTCNGNIKGQDVEWGIY
jgi:GH18 family chitinase